MTFLIGFGGALLVFYVVAKMLFGVVCWIFPCLDNEETFEFLFNLSALVISWSVLYGLYWFVIHLWTGTLFS